MYKIVEGYKVVPRQTWYEDENYHMTYEEIDGQIFVHLEVEKVSKSVLKNIEQKWEDFKARLYYLGYEYIFTYTNDLRFPRMFGAKSIGKWNGKEVMVWELN